ncbi:MAG: tRNA (adenosine(37)-N6)-threonylcarbamoyltransferase complex dimerization subunit type 1 TsaB, partial [Actinobacteria bacterium]|nr:tRNA (adenosine(37)-N6)-threonylcarbamoyltransferase complex dimerization subunit type 1 TsaB [Actinomycetota bacterium]
MIVLGIDTATSLVSVAVADGRDVLAASESRSDRRHAEDLTPMVEFVVKRAKLTLAEIEAIAVNVGPGLFTGMRVGIATAQALAQVLGVRLVGIDGLTALAASVPAAALGECDVVVPTIDTRRREVAWSLHRVGDDGTTTSVAPPRVGSLADLVLAVRERGQNCRLIGEFARRNAEEIREAVGAQAWCVTFGDESLDFPHARAITQLAIDKLLEDYSHD